MGRGVPFPFLLSSFTAWGSFLATATATAGRLGATTGTAFAAARGLSTGSWFVSHINHLLS